MKLVLNHVSLRRIIFISVLCCHCHVSTCLGSSQFSPLSKSEQENEFLNGNGKDTSGSELVVPASGSGIDNVNVSKKRTHHHHRLTSNDVNNFNWVQLGNDVEGIVQEFGRFGKKVAASGDGSFVIVGTEAIDREDDEDEDYDSSHTTSSSSNKKVPQSRLLSRSSEETMIARKSKKLPKSNSSKTTTTSDTSLLRKRSLKSDGYASVYHYDDGEWGQFGDDFYGDDLERCGSDVAINKAGDRIFIGCPYHGSVNFGRVRVYHLVPPNEWEQLGEDILGYNYEHLGAILAVSDSGNRMVTSGSKDSDLPRTTLVRIFEYDENVTEWFQLGGNITGNELFGDSVDISGEGYDVVVGSSFQDYDDDYVESGIVRIYHFDDFTEQWDQIGDDISGKMNYEYLGFKVAISVDGRRAIASNEQDEVLIYDFDDSLAYKWKHVATLFGWGYTFFGRSLDMTNDGNRVIVGAYKGTGYARAFEYNPINRSWSQLGQDLVGDSVNDYFGSSVAISGDGRRVVIGGVGKDMDGLYDIGHVRVFESEYTCDDSPLKVLIRKSKKSAKPCSFISKRSETYCEFEKFQTHCPSACHVCETLRSSDSMAFFMFEEEKRNCKWLRGMFKNGASKIIDLCQKNDISATCRETCGYFVPKCLLGVRSTYTYLTNHDINNPFAICIRKHRTTDCAFGAVVYSGAV